jgi:hypothetical protein
MLFDQALVTEDGNAGDSMHVLLVEKVNQLRDIVDIDLMLSQQWVLKRDVDAAVGVFNVENYRIASNLTPVADDPEPAIARSHHSR